MSTDIVFKLNQKHPFEVLRIFITILNTGSGKKNKILIGIFFIPN